MADKATIGLLEQTVFEDFKLRHNSNNEHFV